MPIGKADRAGRDIAPSTAPPRPRSNRPVTADGGLDPSHLPMPMQRPQQQTCHSMHRRRIQRPSPTAIPRHPLIGYLFTRPQRQMRAFI
jgi:hypothetical protein